MAKKKVKTTDPQDELLTQVDRKNNVLGSILRKVAHEKSGIFYRTIYVLVINSNGKILIHKRSSSKDLYPDCWDLSVGGHVNYQDSYRETAAREIREELGLEISANDLALKGEVLVKLPNSGEFYNMFEYYLKPGEVISASKEEIDETRWMTIGDIKQSIKDSTLQWYERPIQVIAALY